MKISSAIIYCPREDITEEDSLEWVLQGGFDHPEYISKQYKEGIIHNYIHACHWMLDNTDAEWIVIWENDVMPCFSARYELEDCIRNKYHSNIGSISLYTPVKHAEFVSENGWNEAHLGFDNISGQAVCYHRDRLKWLLEIYNWKTLMIFSKNNHGGGGGADYISGGIFLKYNMPVLYHNPSLCEHMGVKSARKNVKYRPHHVGFGFDVNYKRED